MQYKDVFDMDFAHHNNNNNSSNSNAASSGCNEVGSTSNNSSSHVVSASLAAGKLEGMIIFCGFIWIHYA